MKKTTLFIIGMCLLAISKTFAGVVPTVIVKDSIATNTHWDHDHQYLLTGYVYVTAGTTLTIDSGTIIRGDKDSKGSLIIERGAKLMAVGTPTNPIVFTSNQAPGNRNYGDWGGVIICGYAQTNWSAEPTVEGGPRSHYGGGYGGASGAVADPHDNSGRMSYCRIEFPGIAFSPNNEINGLTLCGVGDGTQIDHIQVSYSGDDSYEWFGGSVNAKYLVAYRGWDDDFDTDNGYNGKNQFVFSLRDPDAADQSGSKAFESDSYQSGTATGLAGDTSKITKCLFVNCTVVGPVKNPSSGPVWNPNYVSGAHIRRGSAISILNSVIVGWPAGVLIDESSSAFGGTTANIANGILQFGNNIIVNTDKTSTPNPKEVVYVKDGARSLTVTTTMADTTTGNPFNPFAGPWSWLKNPSYANITYAVEASSLRLNNPFNLTNPYPYPTTTSPICYNAAHPFDTKKPINYDTASAYLNYNVPAFAPDFTSSKASNSFFDKVNFVGAFSGAGRVNDNWMANWTNFNCQNTDYTQNISSTAVYNVKNFTIDANLYPNPTQDVAYLEAQLQNTTHVNIALTDINGRIVKQILNAERTGNLQVAINLTEVPAGLYFVRLTTEYGQKSMKLSVIK